jgi:alanine-glyoxylate transaminase/serine-glyoxylate transaminase/serine-pyruvate transaminase
VQSWFLDLELLMGYWDGDQPRRSYHHTAPVNALYGLHEALVMHREEGREAAWARHRDCYRQLAAGLEHLGLALTVDEPLRMPQLNPVAIPDGVIDADVRRRLLDEFDLEIGAGLGALAGRVWRIGIMGESARAVNVHHCIASLRKALS